MSDPTETTKPDDATIIHDWNLACRIYRRGRPLGQRIALSMADRLEARGVTEADIDRVTASGAESHG